VDDVSEQSGDCGTVPAVARRPVQPTHLLGVPFRGSVAVRGGLLTPDQLRTSAWRRLFRDVYVHRDVSVTHELRAVAAARLLVPGATVTGRSAAVLWGLDLAGAIEDVELTVPAGRHPVRAAGIRVRRAVLAEDEVTRRRGVPITTPEVTAIRLASSLPRDDAVVVVDQMVEARLVDLVGVRRAAAAASGAGSARARLVCDLADGLAQSPQETRLRLLIHRSGLPVPVAQFPIRVAGRVIARPDFAWPEHKVAVEYDGRWHGEPRQFAKDRERMNRLRAAGWQVVFVTAEHLRRPELLIAEIAAALGLAVVHPSGS
jgi:hypothetical protein